MKTFGSRDIIPEYRCRKKIVFVVTDLAMGGAEIMLYRLLSQLDSSKFQAYVISLMEHESLTSSIENLGVPVHSLELIRGSVKLTALWRLVCLMYKIKPDLIQGWMYHANIAVLTIPVFYYCDVPILWSIHNSIYSLSYEKKKTAAIIQFSAYFSKFLTQVIYVSRVSQQQHEALGFSVSNGTIIPNGIDCNLFMPSAIAHLSVKAELGLPEYSILIGLIARFDPLKDHSTFIEAASLIAKKVSDIHFLLIGALIDRENTFLYQMIQRYNLLHQFHLLGERSDIPRLMASLDIATSSSYSEAFSLAIAEAMACGVPCVVTDVGDSAWIVSDTGRVVPVRSPQALADAWQELIDLGQEKRKDLGNAARSRILEKFSLNSVVAQYEALYQNALASRSTSWP
jgi:glycosyltransferase involved in cell wall biosynthesis